MQPKLPLFLDSVKPRASMSEKAVPPMPNTTETFQALSVARYPRLYPLGTCRCTQDLGSSVPDVLECLK